MTLTGKLFLMFNLAISFLMAFAAFGLYATNLDYDAEARAKSPTPQPPARYTELQNQIKDVQSTLPAVEGSWTAARADLLAREDQRRLDQDWYDGQMELLRKGLAKARETQCREIPLVNHLPDPDPANFNRPKMKLALDRALQPLLPLSIYLARLETAQKENKEVLARLEVQINEDIRLTNLLTGTGDPPKKGLRLLLVEERAKREDVDSEYSTVRPLFVNVAVESELIRKRYESMQEQIAKLKMYLQKKHKVDVAKRGR